MNDVDESELEMRAGFPSLDLPFLSAMWYR